MLLLLFRRAPPLFYSGHPVKPVKVVIMNKSLLISLNLNLNLNLNSLLVKRQIDNPSPGAVTGGN